MNGNLLAQYLVKQGVLKTPSLVRAFSKVDRADFVLPDYKEAAYTDHALPIGLSQTISQPFTVAFMLELLQPRAGEKILEIGSGSGWQTALLAEAVGLKGQIFSLERLANLADMAATNLQKYPALKHRAKIILTDGSLGYINEAPYDKIIAAAAAEKIPPAWKQQLKIGGRIVAPIKHSIIVIDKIAKDEFIKCKHYGFSFVPLVKD